MVVNKDSTPMFAKREAGGKGFNLYLLTKSGVPVPPWIVLGTRFFHEFVAENSLGQAIEDILRGSDSDAVKSARIRDIFLSHPLPLSLESQIAQIRQAVPGTVAVRSSAVDEDSAQHSFAGQLSSFLYQDTLDQVKTSIKECWASVFTERGLVYRRQNGTPLSSGSGVAVVLQAMIDPDVSGVMFTCNPTEGQSDQIVINSVYGVGEGLVSGLLDADTFVVSKDEPKILSSTIVKKERKLSGSKDATGPLEIPVPTSLQEIPSLSEPQLQDLSTLGKTIEGLYRFPQDIEWAIKDGQLYVLQARPVTTEFTETNGTLYIWDNSNIVESYGGITLPLTFTFARYVYHQVYVQFCEILMVPVEEIRNMDYFLRNMLGSLNGRVYYNLLNWYKLTSILPGFKYNRQFMETMMGTGQGLSDEIADRIKPPGFHETISSKLRRLVTGFKFFYFHLRIQSVVDRFLSHFHIVYSEFREIEYDRLPADEIFNHYQALERRILRDWKAPIINDYLCMVHFGLFEKLTGLWLSDLGPSLQNDLLCGEGNLESAEPTKELIRMAGMISLDPDLRGLFDRTAAEDLMEAIHQSQFTEFKDRVSRYIDNYGFRCMSEMKLEQIDLYQDPTFLFVCLKNYLRGGQVDLHAYEQREKQIRLGAEAKVEQTLKGLKKVVYRWSMRHARKAVRNRENTRFCRTRIYGVVRAMFFGIGRDFALRGTIEKTEDIFYITLHELSGALEGHLTSQNLKSLINLRRVEYAEFENEETDPRFMTRGPVYWKNSFRQTSNTSIDVTDLGPNQLKGLGCCPGVVEGVAKVILSPSDNMDLNGEILVTSRTDPGWIPLYPAVSGLLVERGGLLSHSAIVAREMGLPTVVSIQGLVDRIKTGMRIRFDGQTGLIEILEVTDAVL
jgi:rifampicin phosphotransferase